MSKQKRRTPPPPQSRRPEAAGAPPAVPQSRPDPRVRYATLPLRFFLGATFVYAGIQKVSDAGFLTPGAHTYIGTQLQYAAASSPIGFLLEGIAIPLGPTMGVLVIAGELAIGLAVLLGYMTRWFAVLGALLSATLFLTISWNVTPYFLESDAIYTVAWITLALAGDTGLWSVEPRLRAWLGGPGPANRPASRSRAAEITRRELLFRAGAGAVALVWVTAMLPRTRLTPTAGAPRPSPSPQPSPSGTPGPGASPSSVAGTRIGTLSDLRSQGGALSYTDPKSGDPAVVVEVAGNKLAAFDAVCTHQGCPVQWVAQDKLLECPCHGGAFDPFHGGQVVGGPPPTPLPALNVVLQSDGTIIAA